MRQQIGLTSSSRMIELHSSSYLVSALRFECLACVNYTCHHHHFATFCCIGCILKMNPLDLPSSSHTMPPLCHHDYIPLRGSKFTFQINKPRFQLANPKMSSSPRSLITCYHHTPLVLFMAAAILALALDAVVLANAATQALRARAPDAVMLAYLRSPAFLGQARDVLVRHMPFPGTPCTRSCGGHARISEIPPHSLHRLLMRLWGQMLDPRHSVHWLLMR